MNVHGQSVRLIAYDAAVDDLQSLDINAGDIAQLAIVGIDLHGAGITRDIGVAAAEGDAPAVGDIDLGNSPGRRLIHHLYFVGAIDDGPQLVGIDLQVVADIP